MWIKIWFGLLFFIEEWLDRREYNCLQYKYFNSIQRFFPTSLALRGSNSPEAITRVEKNALTLLSIHFTIQGYLDHL